MIARLSVQAAVPPTILRMGALGLSMLLASLNTSIANAVLPTLSKELGASFAQAQWIVVAYLLATTSTVVIAGRFGDVFGRKRVLSAGVLIFAVGSLLCGLAPGIFALIGARAVQGVGAAVMMSLSIALATEGRAGSALGLLGTMSAAGTAFGPTLGGLLISASGWRAVFLLSVPLALLTYGLVNRGLAREPVESPSRVTAFDVKGAALLTLSLAFYALSMTVGRGRFGLETLAALVVSFVAFAAFVRVEASASQPLVPLAVVRVPRLKVGLLSSTIVSAVMMSTLVVGPYYLSKALQLEPLYVGLALSLGPVVVALVAIPAGRLAERWDTSRMGQLGLGSMLLGAAMLTIVKPSLGMVGYLVPVVALCAGYGVFQTANNIAIMTGATAEQRGVIGGILNLSRNVGLITGASVLAALLGWVSGVARNPAASPDAVTAGMQTTFFASALLVLVALIGLSRVRRPNG